MATFIIITLLLIALALAAGRWDFDSRDTIVSTQWEQRANRTGSNIH